MSSFKITDSMHELLGKENIGFWRAEYEENKPPRLYLDDTELVTLDVEPDTVTPEELYAIWWESVPQQKHTAVSLTVNRMKGGQESEVRYAWRRSASGEDIACLHGNRVACDVPEIIRLEGWGKLIKDAKASEVQEVKISRQVRNFEILHNVMQSGMWFIDYTEEGKPGRVTWSDEFRHMIGYHDATDFPNTFAALESILHPADHAACYETFLNILNETEPDCYGIECRLKTKDRGWCWFRLAGDVSRAEDGAPLQFLGVFQDITDKKEREKLAAENSLALELQMEFKKKLELERDDLATFQYMMGMVGWEINISREGKILSVVWSDELRRLYGYETVEEFPNEFDAFINRIYPEDTQRVQDMYYSAMANPVDHKILEVEYRLMRKDGGYHWYRDIFIIHRKTEWDLPRLFGATADTTEKHARAVMIKEKQRHDEIMNALASDFDYVSYIDVHTREVVRYRASDQFAELLANLGGELPSIEKLECLFKDIVVWEDYQEFWMAIQWEAIFSKLKKSPSYVYEVRFILEGRVKYYQIKFVRDVNSADGLIMGFKNIDSRKRRQQQQQKVISGLSENFECVFAVDIDTMEQQDFRISPVFTQMIPQWTEVLRFKEKMELFAEAMVLKEDREDFREAVSLPRVLQELQRKVAYLVSYRIRIGTDVLYYQTKFIHGGVDDDYLVVGFASVDEKTRRDMREKEKLRRDLEIIDVLASEYASVYYIDLEADSITPYTMDERTEEAVGRLFNDKITYTEVMHLYVDHFLYEPDKQKVLSGCEIGNLREKLKHQKTYQLICRSSSDIDTGFSELKFVKVNNVDEEPTAVALAIANKNEEIMRNYVDLKIYDNFLAIYLVNLESNTMRTVKESGVFENDMMIPCNVFSEKLQLLALRMGEEHKDEWLAASDPGVMQQYMKGSDRREYIYNLKEDPSSWERLVVYVLERNAEGAIETAVISLEQIDNSRSEKLALDAKIAEQNAKLEEQQLLLAEAFEQARHASEAKTIFLNNMSHDIRTPMNAIVGFNKMAQHNIDRKDKLMDCLRKVDGASEHLLTLINDVLDMARIESGKVVIDEAVEDVTAHVGNVESMLSSLAEEKQVQLNCEYHKIMHTHLLIDAVRVDQILINILSNAIKYTQAGGWVHYIVEELEEKSPGFACFRFTVSDNGIGMSKEFLDTIYETFSRERNSTASGVQGTGLGMAIVKKLVDFMGGTIDIQSEPGKGTQVVIELEFRIANEEMIRREAEVMETTQALDYDFSGMKVLLVEDNELNREIAREIMQEVGIEVEEATDGIVAVKMMEEAADGQYDLILMDIQMPLMDGYEATTKIRQLSSDYALKVPIVAMTANVFAEDKIKAKEAGMNGHLGKPIDISELMNTLSNYNPKKIVEE